MIELAHACRIPAFCFVLAAADDAGAQAPRLPLALHYTVAASDALGSDGVIPLQVTMRIDHPVTERTVFAIPVWTPGSYRLRPFPERIHDLIADAGEGRALPVQRLDQQTWQVKHGVGESLRLRYRVDLRDDDRFMLRGRLRRCITYEGPAVYLYLRDHPRVPCHVTFAIPADWQVGTGLAQLADGRYYAPDYDVLADCPVKLGRFQSWAFAAHGKRIEVVVDGPGDVEFAAAEWLANVGKVVGAAGDLFGGLPFDRYVFLFTASPGGGGGGLEHLYSTCIGLPVAQLRRSPTAGMTTIAHEFFHAFNVKRLRPVELGPFDYSRPNRTEALWLMEGVTSYYADVLLARCGLLAEQAFWSKMAGRIQAFEASPARHEVSSAQTSYTVWDARPPDRALDYYTSGAVLGLLLDLELRGGSGNTRSLDDVMRALWRQCEELGRGLTREEIVATTGAVAGRDLREWFDRHVRGTVVPDYARILGYAGLAYEEKVTHSPRLRGLQRAGDAPAFADPDRAQPGRIDTRAGRIVAVDGTPVQTLDEVEQLVAGKAPGATVLLRLATLTGAAEVRARITERIERRVRIELAEAPSAAARAIRAGITGGR